MALSLESAPPSSRTVLSRPASRSSPYTIYDYPAPNPLPVLMSPQSLHSYLSHLPETQATSQELDSLPVSGWYGPSISAPNYHGETSYATYGQYIPPHTSSMSILPPASTFGYQAKHLLSNAQSDQSGQPGTANSPSSVYSGDSIVPDSARPSEEPQRDRNSTVQQPTSHLRAQSHLMDRPHSSSNSLHRDHIDTTWSTNPLGIHSPHNSYYPTFPTVSRSPRLSEPLMELPPNHLTSPPSRRIYTPIAPLPIETPRSHVTKRCREEDEEVPDESKRRKRSDSTTSAQFELSEEDKLLLQLKEEESMPWKDIAARFQSDLGKTYQIPALQMRLKRLRERMRVWTETDVKALRMAHEYWAQSKFDIIAHKMVEFGAQEKWTARQCARKWTAEVEPASYAQFEQHVQQGFAPYAMSPVEPPTTYLPFLNV
ncbi:hypothetical protein T440DRAFT_166712 [Plenodomus tracheiphilus IPT5]|uniref:Myb-like domain-containing protein n=1 Tax=Plenodomus tracheiphilus IPT5 TaxID=1408161 RepID=A0A6A7AZL3_9PLEO|nr:hypothetical protein T440DRAFT_166712 [Plenodomus tracheiphilus IPT5]